MIHGEADPSPSTFGDVAFNISSRPTTNASVSWSPVPWNTVDESNANQRTPDLTTVIQELVNQTGFSSASPMAFIISGTGERTADAYDSDPNKAAKLFIEYSYVVNNPPSISLSAPYDGQVVNTNELFALNTIAYDLDGTVTDVKFYLNGQLLTVLNSPPFNTTTSIAAPGNYTLFAVATDNLNQQSSTAIVNIVVESQEPPVVQLTNPVDNDIVTINQNYNLNAIASDADGTVTRVDFYENNTFITSDLSSPYLSNWTPQNAGNTMLKAVATDDDGNTSESMVNVTVMDDCDPPQNVFISNITVSGATILWDPVVDATAYNLEYREVGETVWQSTMVSLNFAILSGLESCSFYEYQISADCSGSPSGYAGGAFTTLGNCGPGNNGNIDTCDQIENIYSFNITDNSVALSWDLLPNSTYTMYYKSLTDNTWQSYTSPYPLALLFGLDACETYEWYIMATCANGQQSDPSPIETFTTIGCVNGGGSVGRNASNTELLNTEIQLLAYPNPVVDYLTVEFSLPDDNQSASARLIDMDGKIIFNQQFADQASQLFEINMIDLPKGMYLFELTSGDKRQIKKITK